MAGLRLVNSVDSVVRGFQQGQELYAAREAADARAEERRRYNEGRRANAAQAGIDLRESRTLGDVTATPGLQLNRAQENAPAAPIVAPNTAPAPGADVAAQAVAGLKNNDPSKGQARQPLRAHDPIVAPASMSRLQREAWDRYNQELGRYNRGETTELGLQHARVRAIQVGVLDQNVDRRYNPRALTTAQRVPSVQTPPAAARTPAAAAQPTAQPPPNLAAAVQSVIPGATVTSTQRTPERNREVGGVPNSMHVTGEAMDIVLPEGTAPDEALRARLASALGVTITEFIPEGDHLHVGWRGGGQASPSGTTQAAAEAPAELLFQQYDQTGGEDPPDVARAAQALSYDLERMNAAAANGDVAMARELRTQISAQIAQLDTARSIQGLHQFLSTANSQRPNVGGISQYLTAYHGMPSTLERRSDGMWRLVQQRRDGSLVEGDWATLAEVQRDYLTLTNSVYRQSQIDLANFAQRTAIEHSFDGQAAAITAEGNIRNRVLQELGATQREQIRAGVNRDRPTVINVDGQLWVVRPPDTPGGEIRVEQYTEQDMPSPSAATGQGGFFGLGRTQAPSVAGLRRLTPQGTP